MWVFVLLIVAVIVLFVIGLRRASAARAGMSVTVNKSGEAVRQIIMKQFAGLLWVDLGSGFRRRTAKQGYSYVISYEISGNGMQTTVRFWLSSGGFSGAGALSKIKNVCARLQG